MRIVRAALVLRLSRLRRRYRWRLFCQPRVKSAMSNAAPAARSISAQANCAGACYGMIGKRNPGVTVITRGSQGRWFLMASTILERFWAKVDKNGPVPDHVPEVGNCWVWTGASTGSGYGRLWLANGDVRAHRAAWEIENGPIPHGSHHGTMCVLHRCDNRMCVRPSHLFLGTNQENMNDRGMKGRQARGSKHGRAKMTPAKVVEMREGFASGAVGIRQLARENDIAPMQVRRIISGAHWRHVGGPIAILGEVV